MNESIEGFLEVVREIRTHEEKLQLFNKADQLAECHDAVVPTAEELKELSEIFTDLPRDGWEMFERQHNAH
jgi:hypothetical protein